MVQKRSSQPAHFYCQCNTQRHEIHHFISSEALYDEFVDLQPDVSVLSMLQVERAKLCATSINLVD